VGPDASASRRIGATETAGTLADGEGTAERTDATGSAGAAEDAAAAEPMRPAVGKGPVVISRCGVGRLRGVDGATSGQGGAAAGEGVTEGCLSAITIDGATT
jgi:hypothetical protein